MRAMKSSVSTTAWSASTWDRTRMSSMMASVLEHRRQDVLYWQVFFTLLGRAYL